MMPASNSGVGMNIGFPDVCVTPVGPVPTPIPYPNMALNATAVPFAESVFISFMPGLNMSAEMPVTLGDQAGTLSPFMGPGHYTLGNPTVMIEAMPAINLLCPTSGNNMINGLGAVMVPSITNVFFSRAGATPGDVDVGGIAGLSRALDSPREEVETTRSDRVAWVRIAVFSAGVPARVHTALTRIGLAELAALVIDLRGCPGGELVSALELARDFLDDGAVLATVTDSDGDDIVYRARRERTHRFPLFVLVDVRTASAAELFAGCLQAHGRAVVIGERTYGKGTAQKLLPGFAVPGAHYLTLATITLPNGEPLDRRGVQPDIACPTEAAREVAEGRIAALLGPA
jgi:carboxyl-terminal processing protease